MNKKMRIFYIVALIVLAIIAVYALFGARSDNEITGNVITYHPLEVTISGTGSGYVDSWYPEGLVYCETGTCTFSRGTDLGESGIVDLRAVSAPGSVFKGWKGACSGTKPTCQTFVWRATEVGAEFTASSTPQQYNLYVASGRPEQGVITSNISGILCPSDCNELYDVGTVVEITATPNPGYTFYGWSGDCQRQSNKCVVTMNFSKNAIAYYNTLPGIPQAPTSLVLTSGFDSTLGVPFTSLNWIDNSFNENGFIISRAEAVGKNRGPMVFAELARVGGDVRTYRDISVRDGKTYVYKVEAYNDIGVSSTLSATIGIKCRLIKKLTFSC